MAPSSKWTAEEDSILVEAVVAAGSRVCWKTIAKRLSGRTNKACRKRWVHSLDPSLRKGRWITPEDALLIMAVRRHGRHWHKVAELLPGRTDDQCAKRWREKLDPTIRRDAWTEAEDLKLLEALEKHGKRWNVISGCIKGRPAVRCRNRFLSLQKAGKVPEDGKFSPSVVADHSPTSNVKMIDNDELSSYRATIDTDAQPEPSTPSIISTRSPSPSPHSPLSSVSSAEPAPISAASPPPSVLMESLGSTQIPADFNAFQMSLDLVCSEFFSGQNSGTTPNLDPPSPSPFIPSSMTLSKTFEPNHSKYAGTPFTFPIQASTEQLFGWEEAFITSNGRITAAQMIQDLSMPLARELVQESHSSSEGSSSLVMTCPLPLCSHQSNELISIWRHITWDHLGNVNRCSKVMAELIEKVVLGVGE